MVVFHCGINQKHNPTLIPKAHQIPANTNHKPVPSLARALAMLYEFQGIRTPRLSCILAVLFPGSALPCGRPNPKLGGTNGFCKKQQQENPGEIQTHLEEQRMLIWVWLWHMQGKKRKKQVELWRTKKDGQVSPSTGHIGATLSWESQLDGSFNPALIPKAHLFQPTRTTSRHLPWCGTWRCSTSFRLAGLPVLASL